MLRSLSPGLLVLCSLLSTAQTTLRVMDYNLLNFPEPNPPGKVDTLAKILAYHPVDLLICEEIRTEIGANMVLDQALNVDGETRFSMAEWEPMHSDPGADYFLQQIIYYDHNKLTLKEQGYLITYVRDLNWYTLYVNAADLAITHDTVFFTVFAVHLKAGNTTYDEDDRAAMAQTLVNYLPSLPADRHVIVAGDMNLYTGFEPAFQTLIDNSNAIDLDDPINTIGSWNNNSAYAQIHTQSTRVNVIYSDGAGGGLDDRFDFGLMSSSLLDATSTLHYSSGSYHPLGNSGDCFNQNVIDCNPLLTPYYVLRALYYMSDHLPVVFDLVYDAAAGVAEVDPVRPITLAGRPDGWVATVPEHAGGEATFIVRDMLGRELVHRSVHLVPGTDALPVDVANAGLYVAELRTKDRAPATSKAFLHPL